MRGQDILVVKRLLLLMPTFPSNSWEDLIIMGMDITWWQAWYSLFSYFYNSHETLYL